MDLLPNHALPAAQRRVVLYYEAYGASDGDGLATTITVERRGGLPFKRHRRLEIRFEDEQRGADDRSRRSLDLSALEPGAYTLTVHITAGDGRTAKRSTPILLR